MIARFLTNRIRKNINLRTKCVNYKNVFYIKNNNNNNNNNNNININVGIFFYSTSIKEKQEALLIYNELNSILKNKTLTNSIKEELILDIFKKNQFGSLYDNRYQELLSLLKLNKQYDTLWDIAAIFERYHQDKQENH
ncbi:hypothetical protein PACTADRAFT_48935 [Pachysolen tannophilus NRRL Y-2460]|uniref:Uncharacterized protein n=1 Tax=Pachysolen tannophilus NRRL Y-2460 TaxID=669874 RepID=A0A1E4TZL9_PACTA|nr:hypothetical protein PACTADRAFT_48935 [Pachysolen tannophilus NRRL Y-2460]